MWAFVPTFRGLRPAKRSQHVPAGQVEFLDSLFDILFGRHRLFGILRNVRLLRLIRSVSIHRRFLYGFIRD